MRSFVIVLALLAAGTFCAHADSRPFHAGMTRIAVQDIVPFDALIAYPTDEAEVPFQAGPFTIAATRDAPISPIAISLRLSHAGGTLLLRHFILAPAARWWLDRDKSIRRSI